MINIFFPKEALARTVGKECSQFVSTVSPYNDPVAFTTIGGILTTFTSAIILVAGMAALIFLILGGVQYITSGGDKAQAQAARERITYAILGLAIVASSVAINQVLGAVFGFNIFNIVNWPAAQRIVGNIPPSGGACQ